MTHFNSKMKQRNGFNVDIIVGMYFQMNIFYIAAPLVQRISFFYQEKKYFIIIIIIIITNDQSWFYYYYYYYYYYYC